MYVCMHVCVCVILCMYVCMYVCIRDPEWPSGLLARSPRRRPGFDSGSVGLSEINFSDLYCGWLGRIINVEYNTIQHNTIQLGRGGIGVCLVPAGGLRVRIHLKATA